MRAEVLIDSELSFSDIPRLAAYDLVFFKSKDTRFLDLMAALEAQHTTRVINSVASVRLTRHRQASLAKAAAAGVPTPDDFLGPLQDVPFPHFVVKAEFEDDPFKPRMVESPAAHNALIAELGANARIYAQRFISTDWEYKLYAVSGEVFAFRQRPMLFFPDKLATRETITAPQQLVEWTRLTGQATGLDTIGVDFLTENDQAFLTDINSIQGVQNFPEGCEAMIDYFGRRLLINP